MNLRVPLRVVGLMSGTSADGVDAALVEVEGGGESTSFRLDRFVTLPYSSDVRESLLDIARDYTGSHDIACWHFRLGELLAEAANAVLQGEEAHLVASHGHTVAHVSGVPRHATLQLGSPSVLAELTGLTVVSDFRSADIAAGGEGAPLVSFVDILCLRDPIKSRILLNIGGMANVTYVPAINSPEAPRAFDTGPGNALIDSAVYRLTGESNRFDAGGQLAARGVVRPDALDWLLRHPYLRRPPPKSTGREEFGEELADAVIEMVRKEGGAPEDVVATVTAFTAKSIAVGLSFLPDFDDVVVAGGGIHNDTLMNFLEKELNPHHVAVSDLMGIPADAKEALVFAVLANQTIRGLPGNVPGATGARHQALLGSITPGRNFVELMQRLLG